MIQEMSQSLIAGLQSLSGIEAKSIIEWSGDPKELLSRPKTLPAIRVIYDGTDFNDTETFSDPLVQETQHRFDVILFYRSIREEGNKAYPLIDSIYKALDGYRTNYGRVYPVSIKLLSQDALEFVYVISVLIKGITQSENEFTP